MRTGRKKRAFRRVVLLLCCAAALVAGGLLSLRHAPSAPGPTPPRRTSVAPRVPRPAASDPSVAAPIAGDIPSSPPAEDARAHPPSKRPKAATAPRKAPADLSAYGVRARSAEGESYLPRDRSLSAAQLEGQLAPKSASDDKDHGLLGDIARGARKIVKAVDDAALSASRRALGDVARPDKARIRPQGDGVRLHINIPAHTVDLDGKK